MRALDFTFSVGKRGRNNYQMIKIDLIEKKIYYW